MLGADAQVRKARVYWAFRRAADDNASGPRSLLLRGGMTDSGQGCGQCQRNPFPRKALTQRT
jgi:hypothetical protein